MTRDEIVAALVKCGLVEWKATEIPEVMERAGLTVIPTEPGEDEVERVREAIQGDQFKHATTEYRRVARAAARAVRTRET